MNCFVTPFWKLSPPPFLEQIASGKVHPNTQNSTPNDEKIIIKNHNEKSVESDLRFPGVDTEDLKDCWKFGAKMLDRMMFLAANIVLVAMFISNVAYPLGVANK